MTIPGHGRVIVQGRIVASPPGCGLAARAAAPLKFDQTSSMDKN